MAGKLFKIAMPLILIVNLITLSGCWDIREINELGLVTPVGIDSGDSPGTYGVTVQIGNPGIGESSSGSEQSKPQNDVWVGTGEGKSIFEAIRRLANMSSRRIMWAHNNAVIIGEALAAEGITPLIDFFTHNPELRMKVSVVVAKGEARDFITSQIGMDVPSGLSFFNLESYRAVSGESVRSQLLDVSAELHSDYSHPLISAVSLKKAMTITGGGPGGNNSFDTLDLSGAAVFRKDRLVGWLTPEEALGVSWIKNETRDTVVTVADPEHGFKSVVVETSGVKAKIKATIVDDMPHIDIRLTGEGNIVEEDGSTDLSIIDVKKQAAMLVERKISSQISNSLEVIQKKYMVDVLGFAAIVHTQNDSVWEGGLKNRWREVFPQMPATVSVKIDIKTSTLNQEPMNIH